MQKRHEELKDTIGDCVIVGRCISDELNFFGGKRHKHLLGFIIIMFDIFCTLIMLQIFRRLMTISEEYTNTIDDHEITMCDFAVMCHNIQLDKYTQNVPLIKMRVWLLGANPIRSTQVSDSLRLVRWGVLN